MRLFSLLLSNTAVLVLLRLGQRLPLLTNDTESIPARVLGHGMVAFLDKESEGRSGALRLAVIVNEVGAILAEFAAQAATSKIGHVDGLGRVRLNPAAASLLVRSLVALGDVLEAL